MYRPMSRLNLALPGTRQGGATNAWELEGLPAFVINLFHQWLRATSREAPRHVPRPRPHKFAAMQLYTSVWALPRKCPGRFRSGATVQEGGIPPKVQPCARLAGFAPRPYSRLCATSRVICSSPCWVAYILASRHVSLGFAPVPLGFAPRLASVRCSLSLSSTHWGVYKKHTVQRRPQVRQQLIYIRLRSSGGLRSASKVHSCSC